MSAVPPAGRQRATSGKAITSLVLGIASFCLPVLLGIPAIILGFLGLSDVRREPERVGGKGLALTGMILGVLSTVGCVPAGIYSFLRAKDAAVGATQRVAAMARLRTLGMAFSGYADSKGGQFPTNVIGPDGKPLLSWRVQLLPYVERADLYQRFRLDEPWDSPHNKALISQMPTIYLSRWQREEDASQGLTYYRAFAGPRTVLGGPRPVRIGEIKDGLTNTILCVEAGEPAIWTKPDDLPFDPAGSLPKMGGSKGEEFLALFADGFPHLIPKGTDAGTIRGLITYDGDEPVSRP
jgi:hypothetical protein